jgi:hypothetical protein
VSLSPLIVETPWTYCGQTSRSHARQIYCAAHERAQGDGFDTFSANADLLHKGKEDFFDLSSMLHSRHAYPTPRYFIGLFAGAQTLLQISVADRVSASDVSLS